MKVKMVLVVGVSLRHSLRNLVRVSAEITLVSASVLGGFQSVLAAIAEGFMSRDAKRHEDGA